jgi:asparagine synthase (glutamine-hydrolysing)
MSRYNIKFSRNFLRYGWKVKKFEESTIWFKGSYCEDKFDKILNTLSLIFSTYGDNYTPKLNSFLGKLTGDFAFICETKYVVIAVVDNISSTPIFYSQKNNELVLSDLARNITSDISLDEEAVLPLIMSGYTIGDKTLNSNVKKLTPFEYIVYFQNSIFKGRYSNFIPVINANLDRKKLINNFYDCLMGVMEDIYNNIKDRHIVVLLSGGSDSRLLVSSLKHIGAKNITCMTYGIPSSEEVRVSKGIARTLGYEHVFIPIVKSKIKDYFLSEDFDNYLYSLDSYSSVPYISEIYQVSTYLDISKVTPDEVVFINGNTGDFINGSHIPATHNNWQSLDDVVEYVYDKHYSMWGYMKNDHNKSRITNLLINDLYSRIPEKNLADLGYESLYEIIEYHGRQSHLIVTNQRTYDFFGSDWRMPFWDARYVEFWESVGICNRINHSLYSEAIQEWNLGGVWANIPINKKSIKPNWIAPLRFFTKGVLYSLNKKHLWKQAERNIFYYWLEPYRSYYKEDYKDILLDNRGQRYYMSWWIEDYLKRHNAL